MGWICLFLVRGGLGRGLARVSRPSLAVRAGSQCPQGLCWRLTRLGLSWSPRAGCRAAQALSPTLQSVCAWRSSLLSWASVSNLRRGRAGLPLPKASGCELAPWHVREAEAGPGAWVADALPVLQVGEKQGCPSTRRGKSLLALLPVGLSVEGLGEGSPEETAAPQSRHRAEAGCPLPPRSAPDWTCRSPGRWKRAIGLFLPPDVLGAWSPVTSSSEKELRVRGSRRRGRWSARRVPPAAATFSLRLCYRIPGGRGGHGVDPSFVGIHTQLLLWRMSPSSLTIALCVCVAWP